MTDASHSFEAYYKRATSPLAVLKLVEKRPMYGYEISQTMKAKSGGRFTISVLYPVLYRLEEQGYLEICTTEVVLHRLRSYYQITDAGRQHLAKTVQEYHEMHQAFMTLLEEDEDDAT